ncbi:cytochrome c [Alloacidobacterium sp.]|uniref:c-type cytochrome n=1 Tax=Alloacidobacterium sp. TaxID=2951999 RepID=UPI002D4374EF|nr:cytochrome c [Alloacidobacterium sp.]HYK35645.1 cytochrome c [Alloacidobacterium sp.]
MRFLAGLILGLVALPIAALLYFHLGHPPVAVADQPFTLERQIVRVPLHARIDREMPKSAPISPSESNLLIGAHIYREQCAACHGLYGRPSPFASHMYPKAPQLWQPHGGAVVGVSDDPPGETFWKVKNGIRLTGMPSFDHVLNETQMWQVSILLANADKPQPSSVLDLLKQPLDFEPPTQPGPSVPEAK